MPFTVSHAAAVLPLKNSRLPLAALMIGSMAPDFPYFLPNPLARETAHSLAGIFLFCLPAGLLAWQFFVRVLERPSLELLPAAWRGRIPHSDRRLSPRSLLLAGIAVIVGAATHVAWDAFTHAGTPITNTFPSLHAEVFAMAGRPIRLYFLLQVLSSVVGLAALAIWALNLRHRIPPINRDAEQRSPVSDRTRLAALIVLVATSALTALLSFALHAGSSLDLRLFHFLIGGMTGWLLAWCAIAVLLSRTLRVASPPALRRARRDQAS